jgi:hypothetical protein
MMKMYCIKTYKVFTGILLGIAGILPAASAQTAKPASSNPRLYIAISGLGEKANTYIQGQQNIAVAKLIGQSSIVAKNSLNVDSNLLVTSIRKIYPDKSAGGVCILDWEGEALEILTNNHSGNQDYQKIATQFRRAITIAKQERPNVQWGIYGLPFRTVTANEKWQNQCYQLRDLLKYVDVICPSLYMIYSERVVSRSYNEKYIENNLRIALELGKELNKPVLPFVWPRWQGKGPSFMTLVPMDAFTAYVKKIMGAEVNGNRPAGVVFWDGEVYYYKQKQPQMLKEAPSLESFIQRHDSQVIIYSDQILKALKR